MSITPQYIAAAVVASDQIAQLFVPMPGRDFGAVSLNYPRASLREITP